MLENEQQTSNDDTSNQANQKESDNKKYKRFRVKRAKNVDTYKDVTVQSNVNTMGESKISKFFKQKFNNMKNKVKNQKSDKDNSPAQPSEGDSHSDTTVDEVKNTPNNVEQGQSNLNNLTNQNIDQLNNTAQDQGANSAVTYDEQSPLHEEPPIQAQ